MAKTPKTPKSKSLKSGAASTGSSPITTKITVQNAITNPSAVKYAYNIVVFEENGHNTIAYYVIQNLANKKKNKFSFDQALMLSIEDAWGNYSKPISVKLGEQYEYQNTPTQKGLTETSQPATSVTTIEVISKLVQGSIKANIFRGENIGFSSGTIVPKETAVLAVTNTIWLGVDTTQTIQTGDLLDKSFVEEVTKNAKNKFKLDGITSITIDLTAPTTGFAFTKSSGGS